jgi:hypothetical protein
LVVRFEAAAVLGAGSGAAAGAALALGERRSMAVALETQPEISYSLPEAQILPVNGSKNKNHL